MPRHRVPERVSDVHRQRIIHSHVGVWFSQQTHSEHADALLIARLYTHWPGFQRDVFKEILQGPNGPPEPFEPGQVLDPTAESDGGVAEFVKRYNDRRAQMLPEGNSEPDRPDPAPKP